MFLAQTLAGYCDSLREILALWLQRFMRSNCTEDTFPSTSQNGMHGAPGLRQACMYHLVCAKDGAAAPAAGVGTSFLLLTHHRHQSCIHPRRAQKMLLLEVLF